MPLQSSIYTVYVDELPLDGDGCLETGYVLVTDPALPLPAGDGHDRPRHVLHAEPGKAPPAQYATIAVLGAVLPWTPAMMKAAHPESAGYLFSARWHPAGDPEDVRVTRRIAVPAEAVILEDDILPNLWAGEEP